METVRRISKKIRLRDRYIGGGEDISVQSMTNCPAHDFEGTLKQALRLQEAGCDIVRMAVPDEDAAPVFSFLKNGGVSIPLVADIHFDYKLALAALRGGADKIRINPGNIGEGWKVRQVADACKAAGVPIRIGVNGGSLDKKLLEKYGSPTAQALAESALTQAEMLEDMGFSDIVISIKSSRIATACEAARIVAADSEYPLHLGVTEAGTEYSGIIKNAIGIGSLRTKLLRGFKPYKPAIVRGNASEIIALAGLWDLEGDASELSRARGVDTTDTVAAARDAAVALARYGQGDGLRMLPRRRGRGLCHAGRPLHRGACRRRALQRRGNARSSCGGRARELQGRIHRRALPRDARRYR